MDNSVIFQFMTISKKAEKKLGEFILCHKSRLVHVFTLNMESVMFSDIKTMPLSLVVSA